MFLLFVILTMSFFRNFFESIMNFFREIFASDFFNLDQCDAFVYYDEPVNSDPFIAQVIAEQMDPQAPGYC